MITDQKPDFWMTQDPKQQLFQGAPQTPQNTWSQPAQPVPLAPTVTPFTGGGDAAYTAWEQQQQAQNPQQPVNPNAPAGADQFAGFLPMIAGMVNQGPWTPEMVQTNQDYADMFQKFGYGLMSDPYMNPMYQGANTYQDLLSGKYDFNPTYSGDIRGGQVNAAMTDRTSANMPNAQIADFRSNQNLNSILDGSAYDNPFLDQVSDAASRRMGQQFNEITMSGIGDQAQAAGQRGGSRQGIAEGIAQRGLADSLGDMNAQLYNNAYQTGFDAMNQTQNNKMGLDFGKNTAQGNLDARGNQFATGLNAAIAQGNTQNINDMARFNATNDLGRQQWNNNNWDAYQQTYGDSLKTNLANQVNAPGALAPGMEAGRGIYDNLMNSYGQPNDALWNQIMTGVQAMNGSGATNYSSTTGTSPDNTGSQLAGNAMMAAAMYFSDSRLKKNIKPMGKKKEFDWYQFDYIWEPDGTNHEGVMAQDIIDTHPDAVIESGGYLMVNYDALGVSYV